MAHTGLILHKLLQQFQISCWENADATFQVWWKSRACSYSWLSFLRSPWGLELVERVWFSLHLLAQAETKAWRSSSISHVLSPNLLSIFHSWRKHALCFCCESRDLLKKLETYFPLSGKSISFFPSASGKWAGRKAVSYPHGLRKSREERNGRNKKLRDELEERKGGEPLRERGDLTACLPVWDINVPGVLAEVAL